MASPLDEVGAYDPDNPRAISLDAPPPPPPPTREDVSAGLDNQEQQLLARLPNTNRYGHRQIADQIAGVRFQRRQLNDDQRQEQTQNRLKAKDLADRGIPTFRNASGGVSPVTDEGGSPLTHYDKAHDIAYDSAGNPKVVSFDTTAGPPALKDPFANIPVQTDQKTGEQYQKRPGLAWNWVGTDEGVKSQRMQEGKDKAVAKEAALIGQKLSIDHADLVAGEKEHNVMTKELQAAVPTLQDPKYAGANRDAVLSGIDEHFNSEYARPEANATNGWFSKDLSPSAVKLRADIDGRKADAVDKANGLFDLKERQIELGDQVSGERDQRKAEIETLIAHGRGQAGPLDQPQGAATPAAAQLTTPAGNAYPVTREGNIDTNVPGGSVQDALQKLSPGPGWSYNGSTGQWSPPTITPDDIHAAAQAGHIPMQVAPAALAAAHDAQDANAKADALQESSPGLAGQFKAVAQGILHGLATGIADIVKGAPGVEKLVNPLSRITGPQSAGPAKTIGEAIQSKAEEGYDKALSHTIGGKIGNFVGGALPFVGASILPGGAAVTVPATVGTLFSAGYGATKEAALNSGASPEKAELLANASGVVNGVLGLPFKGIGGALRRVFGGDSPKIIKAAVESAFQREGAAGAGKLINDLRGYVERNEKPVIAGVAQDVRKQVVDAIDNIKAEMFKTPAGRAATVAGKMASAGALGGGVSVAQNIIAQQYDPTRGTFEGVPENAIGFAALAGVSHGWDQVVRARQAKQALDLLRPGEEGPPAVRQPAGPTPPPTGGSGPSEKPVSGRTVEPTQTEGAPNEQRPIPQAPPTVEPARPEGATSEPVNADAGGAATTTGQTVAGRSEPAVAGNAPAQETAKPSAVSGSVDQAAHEAATSPTNALPEPTQGQQKAGNYQKGHIVQLGGAGGINVAIENPAGSQRSNLNTDRIDTLIASPVGSHELARPLLESAKIAARDGDYVRSRKLLSDAAKNLRDSGAPKYANTVAAVADGSYATALQSHYGYIKGTVGADKDHVDVFVKPGTPTNYSGPVYVVDQTAGGTLAGTKTATGKFDEHKVIIGAGSHEEAIAEYQKNYDPDHQGNYSGVTEFNNIGEFKQWLDSGNKGPAAQSKGVALHPTDEHQRGVEKRVLDRMTARQDVLNALSHPTTPRVGRTSNPSGIETIVTDGTGQITIDPAKLARATAGMPERQQSKFIDRAIDEEILHVAQQEWVNRDPKHEGLISSWGAEKDELDAHMAKAYDGWERLNDRQKGFEKQRAVLQKRWTGKLSEAAYQALQAFIRFLRTIWDKLSDDQRKSVEDVESIMKGQEPVTAPEGFETYKGKHGDTKIRQSRNWEKSDQVVYQQQKSALTKAENAQDWHKVVALADEFEKHWDERGLAVPDDWARWQRAKEDAQLAIRREGDIRKTPPATEFDRRRARRQQLEQRVKDLGESVPATLQTVLRTLLTSGPKREPSVLQLDQAERKLNQIGGENAITTGEKPKGGQQEHSGVSSGENVPTHGGEIRESESGQAGGRGEPVKRPTSPEPRPKAETPTPKPVVSDSGVSGLTPEEQAAADELFGGLGAAKPIVPTKSTKMIAIYQAVKKGDKTIEEIAKDYAMQPVHVEKIYDAVAGTSLGAAAPLVQKGFPDEKADALFKFARLMVKNGVDTPAKLFAKVPEHGRPYLQALWSTMAAFNPKVNVGVFRGEPDWNAYASPKSETVADLHPITTAVQERMISGKPMPRAELTALAEQHGVATKEADELAEAGVVRAARQVVQSAEGQVSPVDTYDKLVKMYENQPNLSAKTATSKLAQALSTPIPIAYVASRLADISGGKIIYEPTAGNGALLIETNPVAQKVHANELNPARGAELKSQGFKVTSNDASDWRPPIKADRMIENPPFGTVKEEGGESKRFDVGGLETTQIDHAITLASLEALADDGRAVLIVGGPGTGTGDVISDDTKREKYYFDGQRGAFWKKLYAENSVIDHFTIAGDLYKKQGAGWPIDMVVINGVGKSPIRLPSANAPRIINSWDELRNELHRTDKERIAAGVLSPEEAGGIVSGAISNIAGIVGKPESAPTGGPIRAGHGPGGTRGGVPEPTRTEPASGGQAGSVESTGTGPGIVPSGKSDVEPVEPGQLEAPYPEPSAGYRVPYTPKSKHNSFEIFTPTNLLSPELAALQKLVDKVGDIDKYALAKTGYDPKDPVKDYLSAEQMDALGLAIDAADRGSAFILGDQGGVGKGRVAAAMMAYAIDRGLIPVFVTRDDKLYAAMIEDLSDIGRDDLIPLFTDNGLNIQDHTGKTWKQLLSKKVLTHIRDTGEMPDGHHVIFTKYTQISSDVPAGYKHPAPAPRVPPNGLRMEALSRIASKALFILDESHLASGDSIVSKRLEPLLKAAPAAYYSSATFAKRPDSVGIYFRTTLSRAAPDMDELIAALRQGGVPLQQAVISMLSDDGLYMRRERDFGKATYHTHILKETTDRDIELADTYTSGIRKILTVANQIKDIADNINKIIKNQGKRMGAPRAPKLSSTNFSAVIHNMVSQYLLAIKAHGAAGRAIEHIKNGRRVVVAVQNTMQSPIEHLRGAGLPITFNGLLLRYLEQQRWLKSGPDVVYISDDKDPEFEGVSDDALVRQFISVQQDPETGQKVTVINEAPVAEYFRRQVSALFKRVGGEIRGLKLGDMPLSPIDYMRQTVEKAGIKTAEITGRTIGIDTDSQIYDIPPHEKSKRAQLGYMSAFNNGDVKFIVLNASGSTGISLHSSTKFKNQEQRALLIVQPHLDINEYIQTLWRIDRTGQVEQPYFEVIQTAIPAELRPAAVLDRKMASLNANTTSNAENELKGGDIDIFNQFGDEVVHNYLRADPHFVEMLGDRKIVDKQGNLVPFDALELESGQLVARVTGRVAILMTAEGEEFYRQVFDNYRALIKYLTDTGQNPFVTDTIDMKAEVLSSKTFTAGKAGGDSVFDSPSALEHIKAEFGRKPRKGEDVLVEADETKRKSNEVQIKWQRMADDWEQAEHDRRLALEVRNLNESQLDEAKDAGATPDEYVIEQGMLASWENRMREARNTIWNALQLLGDTVHLHNARGLDAMGAVVDVKLNEERPMTPSAHEFTVWVNTTQRQIRLAASQLATDIQRVERERFVEQYEESAERSNERYIISGNLLAAAVSISDKGIENARIVRYTGDNGEIKQGILLPANTTPQVLAGKEQVQDYKHFRELLDAGKAVINGNQSMQIAALFSPGRIEYEMKIKAGRATGQRYWGDRSLRGFMANGDFIQKGSYMVGRFQKQGVQGVYERLAELETPLYFWRPLDQTGNQAPPDTTALGAAAPRFARDYWSEDVKPFIQGAGATMHEVVDAAVHVLSPSYGVNTDVVDQVMKLLGERNQVAYVVDRTGEALEKMFASMPRPDLVTFIDRVKRGERQATPELDEAARFVRKVDSEAWQGAWDAAKAAGFKEPPVKWLENHYRVMWKKIPGSEDPAKQWIPGRGKRPLSGSKGMMKQHTLEDMSEGLDQGGVPFSYNPITNEKMALTDIWKYTTALKLWTWGKEHGQVSFVRGPFPKLPDGMSWLDDNIADVWFPADSGEGLIHGGKYAVENGFGRLLNNYLSRDLIRQARTGRTLLWIKNATTALELALSLFHGVFETGEAIGSNIGLGLSKIYNRGLLGKDAGAAMSGMMDLVKSVASPVHIATLGAAFRKAAGRPDEFWQSKEGKAFLKINPDARDLINYLFAGGWKPTEVEADWKNQSVRAFTDAVANLKAGGSSNYLGAGLRAFPAANEFLMTPLFDIYIPNLKIGQFVQEMREALRQEDLKYGQTGYYIDRRGHRYDRPSNAQLARKVWRLVEDRFGELNYDTLFWNNTFKSAMQLMFRSVTWKLGSVEAFGGAFAGQGKEFVNAFKERRAPELHRNMAWLLGVFLLTAALGAVIQKVFAGKDPKGLTDLVFPQIDPRDDKVRVSIPTYFKDLVHLVHSPTGYVKASLAGWIGRVADLLSNKDYYGVQIRNDDDPATKQALQMGRYAAQSILPFSIRGYKNLSQSQENTVRKSMALFGVNPAPRYIGQTAAEQQVEKYWKGQRTEEGTKPEQYEIQKGKREIVSKIRHGSSPDISGALARGTIKPADIPALYKRATMGQLASSIDKMPLAEAEKVFARANPTERAQLAAIIARKRANSLRRSGRTMYAGF